MRLIPFLLIFGACKGGGPGIFSDDTGASDDSGVGGDDTGGGQPACVGDGFGSSATSWALPAGVADWEDWMDDVAESSSSECARGSFTAVLLDLTGDGLSDLVVTDSCDTLGVGTDSWEVYANTGSGFSNSATSWTLPSGVADWEDWLDSTYESSSSECTRGTFTATVFDLTGDAKPDLVVTDDCDQLGVGTDSWTVYANTGSGFSNSPTRWALPSGAADWDDWMDATAESTSSDCTRGAFAASTFDIDGDAKPDLVVTDSCDQLGVGTDSWEIYLNTGSGFANNATTWALPSGVASWDDWMDATAESSSSECTRGSFAANLVDLDGDRRSDLVITDNCDLLGVGTDSWEVYLNTGSGFSGSVTTWALPTGVSDAEDWMDATAESTSEPCTRGSFSVFLADYEGDGRPDLVQTDDCDLVGVGETEWRVFRNTGSGFSSTPASWALPARPVDHDDWLDSSFESTSEPCARGDFKAGVYELNGQPGPEIVITDSCDLVGVGTDSWSVYPGTCSR